MGYLLVIVSALAYSSLGIFGKMGIEADLPISSFLAARFAVASVVLWSVVLAVPRLRGAGRGDLHVVVNVVVPSKVSKRERELLQELDEVSEPAVLPKGGPSIFDWLRDRLFG